MNINYVVGNPPFQIVISDDNGNTKPIYDKFIEMGIELASDGVAMITNNTFLTGDAKAELRGKMIEAGLKQMVNYPKSGEVFNGVGVSACYFNIDKRNTAHDFEYTKIIDGKVQSNYKATLAKDSFIFDDEDIARIANKFTFAKSMDGISLGTKVFGLSSNLRIGFVKEKSKGMLKVTDSKVSPNDVEVWYKTKDRVVHKGYTSEINIPSNKQYIDKYKVICGLAVTKQAMGAFDTATVIGPRTICTESWAIIGIFDTLDEANNCIKYMKTKIYRLGVLIYGGDAMINVKGKLFSHIPAFDFKSNTDVDWSLPVEEIDEILLDKFGFTEEEKSYIKEHIK